VGGLASGAEEMECAPRLWARAGLGSGAATLVKVTEAEKGSPAKNEDCDGLMTTRTGMGLQELGNSEIGNSENITRHHSSRALKQK
jgi:hypothetical protein